MRISVVAGGLLLVTMIVLLSIQLNTLKASHAHIRSQDAKASRLYPLQRDTARTAEPLLRDARGLIKPLKTQARDLSGVFALLEQTASDAHASRGIAGDTHALTRRSVEIQERSLRVQERSLGIQERTLAILEQSLGIQEQTRVHAESIDRKTGGTLPASNP
jgi:hypothetical protein